VGQEVPAEKGVPIRHPHRYADPTFTGDETIPERVVPIHEHHINVVDRTAKLQHKLAHNLEHLAWKLACYADTSRVTAGEATP
jgi:hypothetical protein